MNESLPTMTLTHPEAGILLFLIRTLWSGPASVLVHGLDADAVNAHCAECLVGKDRNFIG